MIVEDNDNVGCFNGYIPVKTSHEYCECDFSGIHPGYLNAGNQPFEKWSLEAGERLIQKNY